MDHIPPNKKEVRERIQTISNERLQLEQELQTLIDSGRINPPSNQPAKLEERPPPLTDPELEFHVQLRKLESASNGQKQIKIPEKGTKEAPKKHRFKREEDEKKAAWNLRKEKLAMLQQKASAIVKENVERKRTRSKSPFPLSSNKKPQDSNHIGRARSKSREPLITRSRSASESQTAVRSRSRHDSIIISSNCVGRCNDIEIAGKNPNLLYPPEEQYQHDIVANSRLTSKENEEVPKEIPNLSVPAEEIGETPNYKISKGANASEQQKTSPLHNILQPAPLSDPFNFINTFKRQLNNIDRCSDTESGISNNRISSESDFAPRKNEYINLNPNINTNRFRRQLDLHPEDSIISSNIVTLTSQSEPISSRTIATKTSSCSLTQDLPSSKEKSHLNVGFLSGDYRSLTSTLDPSSNLLSTIKDSHASKRSGLSKSACNIASVRESDVSKERAKLSLNITKRSKSVDRQSPIRNVTIRSVDQTGEDLNDSKDIHLKFEAEIHLLTDFNKSIHRLDEIEHAFKELRNQNKETQTSIRSPETSKASNVLSITRTQSVPDDVLLDFNDESLTPWKVNRTVSLLTQDSELPCLQTPEQLTFKNVVGMSLRMVDQLVMDEDVRIDYWKKILKIREQILLDRTRSELLWLEMQKKQLLNTGKITEASLIKKKQRGILLKHQQEKLEMQRLKQMQKEGSNQRKKLLKTQKSQIKEQLYSGMMLSDLKRASHRSRSERRLSGPFKVVQTDNVTICSASASSSRTTITTDQEIKSVSTRSSRRSRSAGDVVPLEGSEHLHEAKISSEIVANPSIVNAATLSTMKKTLLMREKALAERRSTVEELLKWHTRLLEEEKALEELEFKVNSFIAKIPSSGKEAPGQDMSDTVVNIPGETDNKSEDSNTVVSNYTADFDVESAPAESSVSSIAQLIDGYNQIEDNIIHSSVKVAEENASDKVKVLPNETEIVEVVDLTNEDVTVTTEKQSSTSYELASEDVNEDENIETVNEESSIGASVQESSENKTDEEKAASLTVISSQKQSINEETANTSYAVSETSSSCDVLVIEPTSSGKAGGLSNNESNELPIDEQKPFSLGSEAEELHKKQLAIEQEIKLLKEQQQKEAASAFYVREIPNKPPPPYTPPSKSKQPKIASVVPATKEEIEQITEYSAKILHKAYISGNLDSKSISDSTLNLIGNKIDSGCFKFVFDLCKEIAQDHYKQFETQAGPSWKRVEKKHLLVRPKVLDVAGLQQLMNSKLFELFNFEKLRNTQDTILMKRLRKKRDHVDQVLLDEMQAEESSWTVLDQEDLMVKEQVTNEIMEMLLKDTAAVVQKAFDDKFGNSNKTGLHPLLVHNLL